ncbi:uncharacterized protein [Ptychodera flava]|uniref:uncharacterized protein n=1 Tax=Ptychodera flava TaxID=63121 RepID=UPI00396A2415
MCTVTVKREAKENTAVVKVYPKPSNIMDTSDSYDQYIFLLFATSMALVLSIYLIYKHKIPTVSPTLTGQIRQLSPSESYTYDLNKRGMEIICDMVFVQSRLPLTSELVTAAAKVLQRKHPLLKMKIMEDSNSKVKVQYFIPMEELVVDVDDIEAESWEDVHAMEMKTNFNLSTGPLWRVRLLRSNENQESGVHKHILAVSFVHFIADGNCIMRLFDELMDTLNQISNNESVAETTLPLLPPVEHFFPQCKIPWWEKILIKSLSKFRGVSMLNREENNHYIRCFPAVISRNPNVVKETRALLIELSKEEVQKLRENCRKHGATVNGATTAAASIAVCKIMQGGKLSRDQQIHTGFMVDMRKYCGPPLKQDESFGFFSMLLTLDVTVSNDSDSRSGFWKLAAKCTNKTKHKLRENGKDAVDRLKIMSIKKNVLKLTALDDLRHVIADKSNGCRSENIFNMSNLGNCSYLTKEKTRDFELVRKVTATGGVNYQSTFSHFIVTFHGEMFWSLVYHTNVCTKTKA